MLDNIFREYDIRGIVGQEFFVETSYKLGKAIATHLKSANPALREIIVARDGRQHSQSICEQITQAFMDVGLGVIDIGLAPTPTLYFALYHLSKSDGLVITASHNPNEYNGVKIWGIYGKDIQRIKDIYKTEAFLSPVEPKGAYQRYTTMIDEYIHYLVNQFAHIKHETINTVFDCGNGSASVIMPTLIQRMGWKEAHLLCANINEQYPKHDADPTVARNMRCVQNTLAQNPGITLGIGFDGDCDRMNPMLPDGTLVAGDKLLALYAQKVIKTHGNIPVIFDIKASSAPMDLIASWGANPILSPSGHALIKKSMNEHKALLAGELSCHFFFKDRYFGFDDGFYAALRLLEIILESNTQLHKLLSIFPSRICTKEIRMACRSDEEKIKIVTHVKNVFSNKRDASLITIDGIRAHMSYGWGLVRASNTQPVICLRFESDTNDGILQVKQDFFEALFPYFTPTELTNILVE